MSSDYKPTSRRPIAGLFRSWAGGSVRCCVRWDVHPNTISYLSVVAAALAGLCFWQAAAHPWLLMAGSLFCYVRLYFNMLDGMVALASGKASLNGEIVNEVPDRISDVIIFAGVAHSGMCLVPLGYWAAILAVFTAYIGIFGQAVGVQREFSGLMAKPWRMVTLHIGATILLLQILGGWHLPAVWNMTVMDWTLIIVIVGCLQTIVVRLRRIIEALNRKAAS